VIRRDSNNNDYYKNNIVFNLFIMIIRTKMRVNKFSVLPARAYNSLKIAVVDQA